MQLLRSTLNIFPGLRYSHRCTSVWLIRRGSIERRVVWPGPAVHGTGNRRRRPASSLSAPGTRACAASRRCGGRSSRSPRLLIVAGLCCDLNIEASPWIHTAQVSPDRFCCLATVSGRRASMLLGWLKRRVRFQPGVAACPTRQPAAIRLVNTTLRPRKRPAGASITHRDAMGRDVRPLRRPLD